MFKKKFLTLGCVLGILACGACFGPPPRPRVPGTPPPLRDSLHRVHTMTVEVANHSNSPQLDPVDFASAVARNINSRRGESQIFASVDGVPKAEARLQVLIFNEMISRPEGSPNWSLSVDVSSSVTNRNGRVLWEDVGQYSINLPSPEKDADQVWRDPVVRNRLAEVLVTRMLHWE